MAVRGFSLGGSAAVPDVDGCAGVEERESRGWGEDPLLPYPCLLYTSICKAHGTAIRIGVNHGSLSDRIMSRYGDTPEGMVAVSYTHLDVYKRQV